MNLAELERKLLQAARLDPPSDQVPYAFEKRVMARLSETEPADRWTLWGQALWRAAAPCVAIMLLVGAWSLITPDPGPDSELSGDIETAVFASLQEQIPETW